jgi:hypothetical protein
MRVDRPTPDSLPVVYDDAGKVVDDPNKLNKTQERAVKDGQIPDPAAHPAMGGDS